MFNINPYPDDFIPGDPNWQRQQGSALDHREPEATIEPPLGSPTCNFDSESGELVFKFNNRLVNFDLIIKGLRETRQDCGSNSVKKVSLWICSDAVQEAAVQLMQLGFDRVLLNDPKNALVRWEKTLKSNWRTR